MMANNNDEECSSSPNVVVTVEREEVMNVMNSANNNRLGKCEVCAKIDARYTCPKCEVKTCSLPCVQIHKKELDCDGIRDRTKFVPLKQMTGREFMSDYYFLEDCTRFVEDRKRDITKRYTRFGKAFPTHLYRLRKAAAERKTTLKFLLEHFTRSKQNTTFFNWKEKHIYWRIEWIFVNASNAKYADARCSEDSKLSELLKKYIDPEESIRQAIPDPHRLLYYQSKGVYGLRILLKAENVKNCDNRYYELDASKTLKENLAHKTIVEFPTIYLFTDTICDGIDLIDSDDDVNEEIKKHEANVLEIREKLHKSKENAKNSESGGSDNGDQTENHGGKRRKLKSTNEEETVNYLFNNADDLSSSSDDESPANAKHKT